MAKPLRDRRCWFFRWDAFALAHGVGALDDDGVGIVDDAVADGVSQSGLTDFLMPATDVELGTENGGSLFVSSLGDFEEVAGLAVLERIEQPFVENQQLGWYVAFFGIVKEHVVEDMAHEYRANENMQDAAAENEIVVFDDNGSLTQSATTFYLSRYYLDLNTIYNQVFRVSQAFRVQ